MTEAKNNTLSVIALLAGIILLMICVPVLFFEIYTAFWASSEILPVIGNYSLGIIILAPSPVILFRVEGIFALLYYLFILFSVTASFILLMYGSGKIFVKKFCEDDAQYNEGGEKIVSRNDPSLKIAAAVKEMPLYTIVTIFAATVSFNVILNAFIVSSGGEPYVPPPSDPAWIDQYLLINASVWEEILSRVLVIGAPMAALGLMLREKGSIERLFGGFGMSREALVFILISAVWFSYAHLSGWDMFKMIPTFVTGLALGYLFVKYGLYASIMLHFIVNYLSSLGWVMGSVGTLMSSLFLLAVTAIGVVFIVRYAKYGLLYVKKIISEGQHPL
ncbi:MAG: CPBP family intramembrane metalloprotease [Methanomassiliicoccaceae archaeon]|nr:CPBP family intramembrane metalloprotease [Methanomassiliicoccaceae archaeon]